jgi:hypothetical protein
MVVAIAGALGVSASLVACSEKREAVGPDGAHQNDDMDVWAKAGRTLARHPAVGTWRTADSIDRPALTVELHHDRTGTIRARASPSGGAETIAIKWRTDGSGRVSLHRDFGAFPSHTAALVLEVDDRRLRAVRSGAGLRATDELVRSGG